MAFDIGNDREQGEQVQGSSRYGAVLPVVVFLLGLGIRLLFALDHEHFCALIDDSFYSLSIARSIAEGNGITYSGIWTNGFQPLYVFLAVPFYRLLGGNDALALHSVLVMMALLSSATGLLLFAFLRKLDCPLGARLGLVVWSLNPYVYWKDVNGLETPLTAFFLFASAAWYVSRVRNCKPQLKACMVLGLLLGLGVLARVDMGFWAVAVAIDMVVFARGSGLRERIVGIGTTAAAAVAVCSPWFVYNLVKFGSVVPTSGDAVRFFSLSLGYGYWGERFNYFPVNALPLRFCLLSLGSSIKDIVEAFLVPVTVLTLGTTLLLGLVCTFFLRRPVARFARNNTFLVLFPLFQVAAYSFWVFGQWFYYRYYYPTVAVLVAGACVLYQMLMDRLPHVRAKADQLATMVVVVLLFLAWDSVTQTALRGDFRSPKAFTSMLEMADRWVPEGETIGAFQSGVSQYCVRRCRVLNLDGVVNPEALEAMKAKRVSQYLRDNDVNWLLEFDWVLDALYIRNAGEPDPLSGWELMKRHGPVVLYRRIPREGETRDS